MPLPASPLNTLPVSPLNMLAAAASSSSSSSTHAAAAAAAATAAAAAVSTQVAAATVTAAAAGAVQQLIQGYDSKFKYLEEQVKFLRQQNAQLTKYVRQIGQRERQELHTILSLQKKNQDLNEQLDVKFNTLVEFYKVHEKDKSAFFDNLEIFYHAMVLMNTYQIVYTLKMILN